MNEKEIKRKLEDNGLKVIDVAREMQKAFPITIGSSEVMLRDLIAVFVNEVHRWLDDIRAAIVAGDPAKLKTFVNDRLAEPWEDPAMRAVKHNIVADRAEPYKLRTAIAQVLVKTRHVRARDGVSLATGAEVIHQGSDGRFLDGQGLGPGGGFHAL